MKKTFFFICIPFFFTIISCQSDGVKTKKFDLVAYGIPLTVKAPVNATVLQPAGKGEVWIQDTATNFDVQVSKSILLSSDITKIKAEALEIVKVMDGFSKLILEEDQGFIYETNFNGTFYDFQYIMIQGDNKYVFQKNIAAESTLKEVEMMYEIVKN